MAIGGFSREEAITFSPRVVAKLDSDSLSVSSDSGLGVGGVTIGSSRVLLMGCSSDGIGLD